MSVKVGPLPDGLVALVTFMERDGGALTFAAVPRGVLELLGLLLGAMETHAGVAVEVVIFGDVEVCALPSPSHDVIVRHPQSSRVPK